MAGLYQLQPDGSALVESPAGQIRMAIDEEQLQALGYAPAPAPPPTELPPELSLMGPDSQALAQNGGAGGAANVPAAPGAGLGGAPAQAIDQDVLDGAASDPTVQKLAPNTEVVNMTRETFPLRAGEPLPRGLRGGAELQEIGAGAPEGPDPSQMRRFARVGGKDIRAAYSKQLGVGPEALEQAEESLADASIQKKLAAQNIAERESQRGELTSGALGRQIRREEQAIIEQEKRDADMHADLSHRQAAIDKERAAIENLDIKPDTLYDREDWAKVIGGIIAIIGAGATGMAGKGGPDAMDRLNEASERSIERQMKRRDMRRQNLAGRETELERLEKYYGDPRAAAAELRDRQRSLVQAYGQKMLVDAGATDALDKFKGQLAAWDEERAHGRLEREQQLGDKVVEQWQYQPERVVQVGGPRALTEEQRKRLVRINGRSGFVVGESDRRPIQEAVSNLEHIGGQLDRLEQIVDNSSLTDIEKQRQIESLAGSLGPALSVAQGQGAMSDDERKRMESRLGDAQALIGSRERAKTLINETRQFFGAKKDSVVRGSVYADPEAGQPFQGAASRGRRYE